MALTLASLAAGGGSAYAQATLGPAQVAPAGSIDTTKRGFLVRTYQTSVSKGGDTVALALQQISGGLLQPDGTPYPNTADLTQAGFDANGIFHESGTVNYNQDSTPTNPSGGSAGAFTPDKVMPGIPGAGTDNFTMEATGFLQLNVGTYTFGVNSDDGFGLLAGVGTHPRDATGIRLGAAEVARGAADTLFTVTVTQAGLYPVRLLQWEDGGGAEVEFFTVDSSNVKHLVNDPTDPDAVISYQTTILPATAYISSFTPGANETNVLAFPNIRYTLEDGAFPVSTASVKVLVNDVLAAGISVGHTNSTTTVTYTPTLPLAAGSTNKLTIIYGDTATPSVVQSNSFNFVVAPYVTLPVGSALPASSIDLTKPGFNVRVAQANAVGVLNNTELLAEALLSGALIDPLTGLPTGNGAAADADGDFTYYIPDVINFNIDGSPIGSFSSTQTATNQIRTDALVPGIPGAIGTTDYALEITAWLQLPAGVTTLGVNSDDGFRVSSSTNITDNAGLLVNRLEVGKGASDVLFNVNLPTAGYFPIRILQYQGGGGGNVEFFSIQNGLKTLINDPTNSNAIKAYALAKIGTTATVGAILPGNGTIGQPKNIIVTEGVYDGTGTQVNTNSIVVTLNGVVTTAGVDITANGFGGTVISLAPPAAGYLAFSTQTVSVVFAENNVAATRHTNTTAFAIAGGITRKFFDGLNGGTVGDLTNSAAYINNNVSSIVEAPVLDHPDRADNYGSEYLGYFYPDHTDDYTFYVSSDDNSSLYLSTDENPANLKLIGYQVGWNSLRDYAGVGTDGGGNPYSNRKSPPIHLIAGQRYFIQALQKEGGGGDSLSVTYTDTTRVTNIVNGKVGTERVQPFTGIAFVANPVSITVAKGRPAIFKARPVIGSPDPVTYQWLKNGLPITGETGGSYTNPAVTLLDNNSTYSLRVSDGTLTAASTAATLTVLDDVTAATVSSAFIADDHTIIVTFNEPVTPESILASGFTLNQGITVDSVTVYAGSSVKIHTTQALTPGTSYSVTINGVKDLAGNITTALTKAVVESFSPGFVKVEVFNGTGGGTTVASLQSSAKYMADAPDNIVYLPSINYGNDVGIVYGDADNYGIRVTGYFTPPTNGLYRFFIRSDDSSELHISTDSSVANIDPNATAAETGCCNGFQEPTDLNTGAVHTQTTQDPIAMTAGQKYAFVAYMKEGGGGDFLQIAVREEADTNAAGTLKPISGTWIGSYADATGISLNITTNLPTSLNVTNGQRVTFRLAVAGTPTNTPVSFQYQIKEAGAASFVDIVGATSASYTTPSLTNVTGRVYRAVVRGLGGIVINSAETTLTTSAAASLTITRVAGQVTITSTVAGVLQSSATVTGAYTDVSPTVATSFNVTPSGPTTFYRLRVP